MGTLQDVEQITEEGLVFVQLSDVEPEKVKWLWSGRIPLGKLTSLIGGPENFKTTIAIDLAARVTTCQAMPDGSASDLAGPADVLFLMGEDGVADTIRPRLDAAAGDPNRVYVTTLKEEGKRRRQVSFQDDAEKLAGLIRKKDVAFVVIDPMAAHLPGVNTHRDADVREALAPFLAMLEETGIATCAVRHLNKNEQVANPMYRSGGSIAFTAVARSEILCGPNPHGEGKVLVPVKMNLAPPSERPSLAYHGEEASNGNVRIAWGGVTTVTAADVLKADGVGPRNFAKGWLKARLSNVDVVEAGVIEEEAGELGISRRTLQRAANDLGVNKSKGGMTGPWYWSLEP